MKTVPVDPIAIVGLAFRFPGDLGDEASFWQALREGRDVVTSIGPERWATEELQHDRRGEPGRSITFAAGVLSRVEEFDAAFFGISPREAAWLDPQQRLLLELTWEAMENGGLPPSRLAGTDTAVCIGISGLDYGVRSSADLASMSMHTMTGNTMSVAANRISYVFDLHGPSTAIDTACSSSLVALDHACGLLRSGEAPVALAGSVNMLLHPYPFVGFTKASMISANGRCRAFDAAGDGYVRAEGGAVLVLKTLRQAQEDGDRIHAIVRASGINADGSRKNGLTIPSSTSQAEIMRTVLARAGLEPAEIDYVEAHGTGTAVGDPVEAAAVGDVYGRGRARPLPIGSVKTNLGHMEAASGMGGLVKAILMLKHGALVPSLHFDTPNPNIPFAELNLSVATEADYAARPAIIGVNSFGFGGTNAHVLLQAAPSRASEEATPAPTNMPPLFLSARSPQALRDLAGRYATLLRAPDADAYDIVHGAALNRQPLEHRLAASASPETLDVIARGDTAPSAVFETALAAPAKIAFVYSGNGAQWAGMGRRLLKESPIFADILGDLDTAMQTRAGFSILAELQAEPGAQRLDDTAVAQPLLFAVQVALTGVLRAQHVAPHAVCGHSVGEVAAAWAAGALTLSQAIDVICARSQAQATTRGRGRMAAVGLGEDAMRALLAEGDYRTIEVAGINSPRGVTLAGDLPELSALKDTLQARGVFFRLLDLDYAFHSRAMDDIEAPLAAALKDLKPVATQIDFVSSVTGAALGGGALGATYWWRNVREPVRFADAIMALAARGCAIFVEIGPHAILQRYISECVAEPAGIRVLPAQLRSDDSIGRLDETAMRAVLSQSSPDFKSFFPVPGRFVSLPLYPWQRERHWRDDTAETSSILARRRAHPLLGWRAGYGDIWENTLDLTSHPDLADHKVAGAVVFPAAGYVEMALAAAREIFGAPYLEVEELDIVAPIVFDGEQGRDLRFEFFSRAGTFQISSRARLTDDAWTPNANGRLPAPPAREPDGFPSFAFTGAPVDAAGHYRRAVALGLDYGPAFRQFDGGAVYDDMLDGRLKVAPAGMLLHPATLDACFQTLVDFFAAEVERGEALPLLPVKIGRLRFYGGTPVAFRAALRRRGARSVRADFILLDAQQRVVASLDSCRFRAASLHRRDAAAPAAWSVAAKLSPHPLDDAATDLPAPSALADRARQAMQAAAGPMRRDAYCRDGQSLLNALVISFAYAAVRNIEEENPVWLQEAFIDGRAAPGLSAYANWILNILRDADLLHEEGGVWRLDADAALPEAGDIFRTLYAEFPETTPDLVFIGRIGKHLAALLQDKDGAEDFAARLRASHLRPMLLDDAPACAAADVALRETLRETAATWPANRRLRILYLTGAGDAPLLDIARLMPASCTDLIVAEADDARLAKFKADCHDLPFVTVALLDPNTMTPSANAALPACYDLIVAHHALHKVENPAAALVQLRRQLARGGQLILAERQPALFADFVAGLDADWWRVEKGVPLSRLQSPATWEAWLKFQGYESAAIALEPADEESRGAAYLAFAQNDEAPPARAAAEPARWLVLAGPETRSRTLAATLSDRLREDGQHVFISAPNEPADLQALDNVVYLAGSTDAPAGDADQPCLDLLALAQRLMRIDGDSPKLWLVTSGGALLTTPPDDRDADPAHAALWGLGRVVMNELPQAGCTLIDIPDSPGDADAARCLRQEFLFPDGETEIVRTRDARYALRVQRAADGAPAPAASRFRLDFKTPGQLRNLLWLPDDERALAAGEVEVQTAAAGLNFRDVMYAMGLLPDEALENGFSGMTLGLEFSGTVSRVGAGVEELQIGDAVMGFGPACFGSHVVTKASAVTKKPDTWSFAQAASVPIAFFTAYYALRHLAGLEAGERVLIHGAAGGVGLAALQVARHLGAEIFATAGSAEKRDLVELLGADHVLDSRSLDYADDIFALTDGDGVDVVLNSLAGEAIHRNFRALRPFGRFLEIGKRDFFENTPIGLRPFKDNISYFGIDADQLMTAKPALAARLYREIMALFETGDFTPLPFRLFPAARAVDAFRTMQQSRHVGKIVIGFEDAQIAVETAPAAAPASLPISSDATYLVTGGLSGLGLETACWLAEHGARHLVLLGRRGMATPCATDAIARLETLGARAHVHACDIADASVLGKIIADIGRALPPLRGIVHAAMVLDDALIANLDAARFTAVMAPKMRGAANLHALTRDLPLDLFVLYSSITTQLGNPGQAPYVAANAWLEGLAALRLSRGLPATCIGWGPVGDAGYLTSNETVRDGLAARLGDRPLTVRQVLDQLGRALVTGRSQIAIGNFDWATLVKTLPAARGPRYEALARAADERDDGTDASTDIHTLIAGKAPDEVRALVAATMRGEVAKILCIGTERINPATPLAELGMDSLMAVELALAVEQRFGVTLPAMALSEGSSSIDRISARLTESLTSGAGAKADNVVDLVHTVMAQHAEDFSAADIEGLVAEMKAVNE